MNISSISIFQSWLQKRTMPQPKELSENKYLQNENALAETAWNFSIALIKYSL